MTKEQINKEVEEILTDAYGGGIHRKANKILLLSGEFRGSASDEIKNALKNLGRAAILLEAHEDLLLAIRKAAENHIRFSVDQHPHHHDENVNHLTLNIHVGDIHIDKQIDPLLAREKEISGELSELNIDYSMLISWLKQSAEQMG